MVELWAAAMGRQLVETSCSGGYEVGVHYTWKYNLHASLVKRSVNEHTR